MRRDTPAFPRDGIYRTILWVLAASTIGGVLIAIGGDMVLHDPAVNRFGAITALISGGLYAFFRFLGTREAKRREEGEDGPSRP